MDGSRETVIGSAERLIRRGELGEAAQILQGWVSSHPDDVAATARLAAVRDLAGSDAPPAAPRAPFAAPPAPQPRAEPLPAEPVARLEALLARVKSRARPR
jgi:hypothetical protein